MTAVTISNPVWVRVESLAIADQIRYGGETYTVARTLPLAVLDGWAVIGISASGEHKVLVYACQSSAAELIGDV